MVELLPRPLSRRAWLVFTLVTLVLPAVGPGVGPGAVSSLGASLAAADDSFTNLKSDERIVFFPTAAWRDETSRQWVLPLHGWIFEPETDSRARQAFLQPLRGLAAEGPAAEILDSRARVFVVDNERNKVVVVRIGEQTFALPPSEPNGHFRGEVRLASPPAEPLAGVRRTRYQAVLRPDDARQFGGETLLVEPVGRTVVSDIDDTVKITEVGDKRRVLENTLLKPFRPVKGMADTYREWTEQGAHLQWVSSSPWQLYEPLAEFFQAEKFPPASWRLKEFRLKDASVLELLADPEDAKVAAISQIVERYPRRKFTLVGDSGERDPEAYGRLARKYPRQVDQIWIRDVTNQVATDERYRTAWQDVPPGAAHVFQDPAILRLPKAE